MRSLYIIWCNLTKAQSQVLLCLFPGVLWLWHFLHSVCPHPVSGLYIYTFVVSRAFTAGAASQAGDADSSRAPGLTSGLQGSVNVHRGALLLVPQWQCISSFVFYTDIKVDRAISASACDLKADDRKFESKSFFWHASELNKTFILEVGVTSQRIWLLR